jgi:hypothetical protein
MAGEQSIRGAQVVCSSVGEYRYSSGSTGEDDVLVVLESAVERDEDSEGNS